MVPEEPIGAFLLVVSDPLMRTGHGSGWDLASARLSDRRWPLYQHTRHRKAFLPGANIAIYVGGSKTKSGHIVAFAKVLRVRTWRSNSPIDPSQFMTDVPDVVLDLENVEILEVPISFREVLPSLSFAPAPGTNFGTLLQGGCRQLRSDDWLLLRAAASPESPSTSDGGALG